MPPAGEPQPGASGRDANGGRPSPVILPGPAGRQPEAPCLEDYLGGEGEHRLRDLLAFGMAVEAMRPVEPDLMRRKAEAELQAHAFRTLHNQVETIRLEAAREQMLRVRRPRGLFAMLLVNLLSLALAAGFAWFAYLHRADWLPLLPPWMTP